MAADQKKLTAAEVVKMSVLHPQFVREQRNARIRAMRSSGETFQAIADAFGLTRARAQQICNKRRKENSNGR
jgi:hypothetical protein